MQKCDPKIRSIPAKHRPTGEHPWGTVSVCQKNFKKLKLQKVIINSC